MSFARKKVYGFKTRNIRSNLKYQKKKMTTNRIILYEYYHFHLLLKLINVFIVYQNEIKISKSLTPAIRILVYQLLSLQYNHGVQKLKLQLIYVL